MADKLIANIKSGNIRSAPFTARELQARAVRLQKEIQRQADEALRDQQRQIDLDALETATAGDIGRIIARLIRG